MSETKFTEGPWSVEEELGNIFVASLSGTVAKVGPCSNTQDDEDRANARLIAAAPELLNACQAALRSLQCVNEQIEGLDLPLSDIEAAIAKVLGKQRDAK